MHPHLRIQLAATAAALFTTACESSSPVDAPTPKPPPSSATSTNSADEKANSAAVPVPGAPKPGEVRCLGIHECKGKSACHVIGGHACAGQNDCKGKGWVVVPAEECESKGGKVLES